MPVDPKARKGKGEFSKRRPSQEVPDEFVEDTIRRAGARAVLLDYFALVFTGFWNVIRGLLKVEGSTVNKD